MIRNLKFDKAVARGILLFGPVGHGKVHSYQFFSTILNFR